jgi:hypothetical protein
MNNKFKCDKCRNVFISEQTLQTHKNKYHCNIKIDLQNTNENVGSPLLQITLKMLKKYSSELGINKISLTDNSIKKCERTNIILSKMLILLSGHTWYDLMIFMKIKLMNL